MGYAKSFYEPRRPSRARAKRDEVGTRYGRLVVLEDAGVIEVGKSKTVRRIVQARCDCGSVALFKLAHLRSGDTSSCGCLQLERASKLGLDHRLTAGLAAFRSVVNGYRQAARKRGLSFELTDLDLTRLLTGNCHYCGSAPSLTRGGPEFNGHFVYNGIDRVNNGEGYSTKNTVSCCKVCNLAKQQMSYDEFLIWVSAVYNHVRSTATSTN